MTRHSYAPPCEVGLRIRELAAARNWQGQDTAQVLGISPSYLSDVILGKRGVSIPMARMLEAAFDVPALDWLAMDNQRRLDEHRKATD